MSRESDRKICEAAGVKEEHLDYVFGALPDLDGDWYRTRWWRVLGPDGKLWCETSDEQEAIDSMRSGDTLQVLWAHEEREWRTVPVHESLAN